MLKKSLILGGALACCFLPIYPVSAEPTHTPKNWEATYNYEEGGFLWIKGSATLELKVSGENYSAELNMFRFIDETKEPLYILSAKGRVENNRLYSTEFVFSRDLEFLSYIEKDKFVLEFNDNGCIDVYRKNYLKDKSESWSKCNEKIGVDYLTAALQVMHDLRNDLNPTEILVVNKEGEFSKRGIKLERDNEGRKVTIPLSEKTFFDTLEARLNEEHEPYEISIKSFIADLTFR